MQTNPMRTLVLSFLLISCIIHTNPKDYGKAAALEAKTALQELRTRETEAQANHKAWEVAAIREETEKIKVEAQARVAEQLARSKSIMSIEDELKKLEHLTDYDLEKTELLHKQALEKMKLAVDSVKDFFSDKQTLTYTVSAITATVLGIYTAKRATTLAADMTRIWLTKPELIDETSRFHWQGFTQLPMQLNRKLFPQKDDSLIVLAPKLKNQMQRIANSTKNIKKNNGYYQHMLLYGSPGTGKTMYCKQLATNSGMDYAIMSGANFDRFNSQESQIQLANLFKWAQRSKKGLLIFIDEADAFLESRQSNNISERTRKLISSFLAHTGTETKNFQIALATNHPENLDTAVLDRTDHKIEFSLPGYRERYKLLQTYWLKHIECPLSKNETSFKEWLFGPENNRPMDSEYQFNNRDISSIAAKTEGFSGRGISKLMLSIRSAGWAYDMPITKELIDTIVTEKVSEKEQVNDFNK